MSPQGVALGWFVDAPSGRDESVRSGLLLPLHGDTSKASGRVFISGQRSPGRFAVSLRITPQSSSESWGLTWAGSSGSALIRWSMRRGVVGGVVRQALC